MSEYIKRKRGAMPSKKKIAEHWSVICGEYLDGNCFACGGANTQRAHIKASCHGGDESLDNLMLLCASCHSVQEAICSTEKGRKNWVQAIVDGAPFMHLAYQRALIANEIMNHEEHNDD